ncbi:hypothetical protein MY4824_004148 [Beauveria thailandica]
MNDHRVRLDSCTLYSIVWIAAIQVELTAASAMLDEEHKPPRDFNQNESDENKYIWGRIDKHNIVVAFLPAGSPGSNSAATTVARFRSSLPHIKFGVLVGIAGAIPRTAVLGDKLCIDKKRDVRLGDVVVGNPRGDTPGVVQYDMGKSNQGKEWERTGSLNQPPDRLLSVVQFLKSRRDKVLAQMQTFMDELIGKEPSWEEEFKHQGAANDRLFKSSYVHRTQSLDCSNCDASQEISRPERRSTFPTVHYGVILSGNQVMKNALERDAIAESISPHCICFEMEAAGVVLQLPCLVIRGMCDYADSHKNDVWQYYAAATAAAYAKTLICHVEPQVRLSKIPCKQVVSLLTPVSESVKKIEQSCETVATAAELHVLSRLPISDEARYDSWEEGQSPLCLPETRQDVFKQLFEWLEKDRPRTLWLNGMAGTGKSTISRSFATELKRRGQLGASFFFKRDDLKRGRAQLFASTIAADLASHLPAVRASIVDTVKSDDRITRTDAKKQFQHLVLDPLSKVHLDKNIVVVIDAVDECDESDLECFFALVSTFQRAGLPGVRLFFTSRPELVVLREFDKRTDECATIALHKVPASIIEHDIRIFLKHELCKVRNKYNFLVDECQQLGPDWPSLKDQEKLLSMSNHLFIFAATICRLLEKCSKSSPDLHLSDLLNLKTTTDHAFEPIYKPVLDRQIPNERDISEDEKEELISEYKQVLGAICVMGSPLSIPALARLLGLDVEKVEHRLRSLQSVVEVMRPEGAKSTENTRIRLLHRSFRDFILSKQARKISRIWVDEQNAHRVMMERCLATLSSPETGLRFNICRLDSPGSSRRTVSRKVLESCLTLDLAYACRNLAQHAFSARFKITDGDEIHQFLLIHLLHWLEALAYLENVETIVKPALEIVQLKSLVWLNVHDEPNKVFDFLKDAYRFTAEHYDRAQAPLQIYTALLFAPRNSIVRKTFEHRYNEWVLEKPDVGLDWSFDFEDMEFRPLPFEGILKLLFSPNKRILAVITWDTVSFMTLLCEKLLEIRIDHPLGYYELPVAVVFSSNSKLIALRNGIDEIDIWNIEDGYSSLVKKLRLCKASYDADYFHRPRSFTHNDNCVLIASHHFADIWSIKNGIIVGRIVFPAAAHEVAVSPDCSTLVGYFDDGLIFWNIESGRQVDRASLPTDKKALSYELVLSSNETAWIITTESTGRQVVYSTTSDRPLAFLEKEKNAYAIFEDYLVVEYEDEINIWKDGDKKPQVIEKPRPRRCPATAIAYISKPSEALLVSTNDKEEGVVSFYKLPNHQPRDFPPYPEDSECGNGYSEHFLHSPNGTMLASVGPEGARILSARRRDQHFICGKGLMENIALSSTGDLLTTSKGDALWIWRRMPRANFEVIHYTRVNEGRFIKSARFSPDSRFILIVVCGQGKTSVYSLAVRNFKLRLLALDFRPDVKVAVLSPDTGLLAMLQKKGVDIWELTDCMEFVNPRHILTIPGTYYAVEISSNSTLALLVGKKFLEIWHIGRKRLLQSVPRRSQSDATFDLAQDVILTNSGKIAFRIASGTGLVSATDGALVGSGSSLAAIPKGPLTTTFERIGWGIAPNGRWITWNDQKWIRLPWDHRAISTAVDGNRVLIMNKAKTPVWFEFDEAPVFEECLDDVDVEMTDCEQDDPVELGLY